MCSYNARCLSRAFGNFYVEDCRLDCSFLAVNTPSEGGYHAV